MKIILCYIIVLWILPLQGQAQLDEPMEALRQQYDQSPNLKCDLLIVVDVEGMHIPDKRVSVEFIGDEKPKVKGEGLSLLPKKGTIDQFRKMLNTPMQAIFLSKKGKNLIYKLVSLDAKSDWITADIIFDEDLLYIYESVVNTRKFGTFKSVHSYTDHIYPSKSVVLFEVKKFKLPLKFIGSEQSSKSYTKKDENVTGKITLFYTYMD